MVDLEARARFVSDSGHAISAQRFRAGEETSGPCLRPRLPPPPPNRPRVVDNSSGSQTVIASDPFAERQITEAGAAIPVGECLYLD
jgi:hypothetical protein